MRKTTIFFAGILVFCSLYLKAVDNSKVKEFADLKCKIALPDGAQWLDQSQVPGCKAFFKDSSERLFILLGGKSKHAINNAFVTGFDSGFLKSANASKISGEIMKFKKVPCYQLYVKMKDQELYAIVRVFSVNNCWYQIQLLGNKLPDPAKNKEILEKIFSAFSLIKPKNIPKNTAQKVVSKKKAAATVSEPAKAKDKAYNFGRLMGKIVGLCIVVIILLKIFGVTRKKNKNEASQEASQ